MSDMMDLSYRPPGEKPEEGAVPKPYGYQTEAPDPSRWMPCNHQLRHWRPLEGTTTGGLLFQRDPESHGFCEVCRAVATEREACAQVAEIKRIDWRNVPVDSNTHPTTAYELGALDGARRAAVAIRARGRM